MSNVRPTWCPHQDCKFVAGAQDVLCAGILPKPEPHENDFNTNRVCFFADGDAKPYDLQFNKSDVWWITRTMNAAVEALGKKECQHSWTLPYEITDAVTGTETVHGCLHCHIVRALGPKENK